MSEDVLIKTLPDGTYVLSKGNLTEIVRLQPGESRTVFGIQFSSPDDTGLVLPCDSGK